MIALLYNILAFLLLIQIANARTVQFDYITKSFSKLVKVCGTEQINSHLPVLLWHGMGDTARSDPMNGIVDLIKQELGNDTVIYSVSVGETPRQDFDSSFFGHLWDQIDSICSQIGTEPLLEKGFNAVGFSQGGLFLRALVEKCQAAKVNNLVTLGSPHAGIMSPPNCDPFDDITSKKCKLIRGLLQTGLYWDWVRTSVVQAQYFKDPYNIEKYAEYNQFLASANNEVVPTPEFKARLIKLKRLALVMFLNDTMVVPKNSAWFGYYNVTDDKQLRLVTMQDSWHYKHDVLGLKTLQKSQAIDFLGWSGDHLRFSDQTFIDEIINIYL